MPSVGDLFVTLSANTAAFHDDMKKASDALASNVGSMKEHLSGVEGMLSGLASKMGEFLAIGALVEWGKHVIEATASLGDMAERTGLSIEALQVFHGVAEDAGQSAEKLDQMVTRLNARVGAAEQGNISAINSFRALGIDIQALTARGVPLEEILIKTAQAIAGIDDPSQRAAAEVALLGGRYGILLDAFARGSGAIEENRKKLEDWHAIVGDETEKTMERMRGSLALGHQALVAWTAQIIEAVGKFRETVGNALGLGPIDHSNLDKFRGFFDDFLAATEKSADTWAKRISGLLAMLPAVPSGPYQPVELPIPPMGGTSYQTPPPVPPEAAYDMTQQFGRFRPPPPVPRPPLDPGAEERNKALIESYQKQVDGLEHLKSATLDAELAAKTHQTTINGVTHTFADFTAKTRETVVGLQLRIEAAKDTTFVTNATRATDAIKSETEAMETNIPVFNAITLKYEEQHTQLAILTKETALNKAQQAELDRGGGVSADIIHRLATEYVHAAEAQTKMVQTNAQLLAQANLTSATERSIGNLNDQTAALNSGIPVWNSATQRLEIYNRDLDVANKTIELNNRLTGLDADQVARLAGEWADAAHAQKLAADQAAETSAQIDRLNGFADQVGATLTSHLADAILHMDSLHNIAQSLIQDLARMAINMAIMIPIQQALRGLMGGAFLGGGMLGADMFMGVGSIATAEGGIFTSPQMRLIGEAGAEAVIPLDKLGGGSSVTINSTVNVQGGGSNADPVQARLIGEQVTQQLRGMVHEELQRSTRPGGILNQGI